MAKTALSAIIGLSLTASGAFAMDWTLKSQLSEQVEIGNNYFLRSPPSGILYVTTSTLGADAIGTTPDMKFEINTLETYRTYDGPGGIPDALSTYNHIDLERTTDDGLTTYHAGASYRTQQLAIAQLRETGIVTGTGSVNTVVVDAGLQHEFTATDTWNLTSRASSINFTEPGSTNYTDVLTTSNWTYRVNRGIDLTNLLQFDWLSFDDPDNFQVLLARAMGGVRWDITRRLELQRRSGRGFRRYFQQPRDRESVDRSQSGDRFAAAVG